MSTVPGVVESPAGSVQTSAGLNALVAATSWFTEPPASGGRPIFSLSNTGVMLKNNFTSYTWSNSGSQFIDSDGGWRAFEPSWYTIQTAGYWSIDWNIVSGGEALLVAYAQVVTTASNIFNPGVTLPFQFTSVAYPAANHPMASSGGLVPIYLFPGDYLEIMVQSATAVNSVGCIFMGQWVSA